MSWEKNAKNNGGFAIFPHYLHKKNYENQTNYKYPQKVQQKY